MKGFCLFSGSKVTNNEEFRKQLQAKNKCLLGLILLGIISAAAAYYMEFSGKMKVDDYMLGVYCGIGVGLICSGIVFLIRNKRLMKDEEKLKEARLQVTDERNINREFTYYKNLLIINHTVLQKRKAKYITIRSTNAANSLTHMSKP